MKFTTRILLPIVTFAAVTSALPSSTTSSTSEGDLSPTSSAPAPPVSPLSNANRLKQGLPPKAPRRRSLRAREAAPSPSPSPAQPTACGRLFVLASDGSYNGFISSTLDEEGRIVVTPNPALAAEVTYSDHRLIPTVGLEGMVIGATFGDYYDVPPLGPGDNNFEGNSGNFAVISMTSDSTPYNSPAQSGITTYAKEKDNGIESAIFKLDMQNNEILPTWINTDGSPHLSTFGMPSEGALHPLIISQNIGSYNAINGGYSARVFCVGTDGLGADGAMAPALE